MLYGSLGVTGEETRLLLLAGTCSFYPFFMGVKPLRFCPSVQQTSLGRGLIPGRDLRLLRPNPPPPVSPLSRFPSQGPLLSSFMPFPSKKTLTPLKLQ